MKKIILSSLFFASLVVASRAGIVQKTITYHDGDTTLEGYLTYDDSVTTPRPGILVIPEWWGLNNNIRTKAQNLAQMGYVAFAADMYGNGKATTNAGEAQKLSQPFYGHPLMATRAAAGLKALLGTRLVDPNRIAAIGFCFGGSVVQRLAYSGADLKGIVSFHGGLEPITPDEAQQVKGKILILHGAKDPFTTPEKLAAYLKSMNAVKLDWQMFVFGGAEHGFTNPNANSFGIAGVAYDPVANQRAWMQMQIFFDELFRR